MLKRKISEEKNPKRKEKRRRSVKKILNLSKELKKLKTT
jgi:hypothetical protein